MAKGPKGWFSQSVRHSNARRFGKAGGVYSKNNIVIRFHKSKFPLGGYEVTTQVPGYPETVGFLDDKLDYVSENDVDKISKLLKEDLQKANPDKIVVIDKSGLKNYESFDKKELKQGTQVEMEHTEDKRVAQKIAKDHLKENPLYYQKLKKAGL